MIIQINTDDCNKYHLTPLELMFLNCKYYNLSSSANINGLIEKGFLDNDKNLTEDCKLNLFNIEHSSLIFVKIWDLYPHKLGSRVFKPKSIDTSDGKHCLGKFNRYIKNNPVLPERVLKGLTNEIALRRKGGSMEYFQDIKTWFKQMTWEKYADLDMVEEVVEKTKVI